MRTLFISLISAGMVVALAGCAATGGGASGTSASGTSAATSSDCPITELSVRNNCPL
jgi:hypothetical protein